MTPIRIEGLSDARREILSLLKANGEATVQQVADHVGITYEAARQQLANLEREGWVNRLPRERAARTPGRPANTYHLTVSGDHLFPKHYDDLAIAMVTALAEEYGSEGVRRVLTQLTDRRVAQWGPRLDGLDLRARLEALKGIYLPDDPYMTVDDGPDGLRLIERNCPFLNVALARPALCSLTISTLTRLLGVRVVRDKSYQGGDGCCVFRVLADQPAPNFRFAFEDA